ncbi:MAG: hypothetical protein Q4F84_08780 [Fibrobacter sp.]|nr:hypothetical protein [Fibrobacter sp.]
MKNIVFTIICAVFFIGCKNDPPPSVQKDLPLAPKNLTPVPFQPSPDSSITIEQMKAWLASNPLLDSLAIMYADSFKTDSPELRIRYQKDFTTAQDKICVLSGLSGGFVEYKWILGNIGNPKNKQIIASVKVESN